MLSLFNKILQQRTTVLVLTSVPREKQNNNNYKPSGTRTVPYFKLTIGFKKFARQTLFLLRNSKSVHCAEKLWLISWLLKIEIPWNYILLCFRDLKFSRSKLKLLRELVVKNALLLFNIGREILYVQFNQKHSSTVQ